MSAITSVIISMPSMGGEDETIKMMSGIELGVSKKGLFLYACPQNSTIECHLFIGGFNYLNMVGFVDMLQRLPEKLPKVDFSHFQVMIKHHYQDEWTMVNHKDVHALLQ